MTLIDYNEHKLFYPPLSISSSRPSSYFIYCVCVFSNVGDMNSFCVCTSIKCLLKSVLVKTWSWAYKRLKGWTINSVPRLENLLKVTDSYPILLCKVCKVNFVTI